MRDFLSDAEYAPWRDQDAIDDYRAGLHDLQREADLYANGTVHTPVGPTPLVIIYKARRQRAQQVPVLLGWDIPPGVALMAADLAEKRLHPSASNEEAIRVFNEELARLL